MNLLKTITAVILLAPGVVAGQVENPVTMNFSELIPRIITFRDVLSYSEIKPKFDSILLKIGNRNLTLGEKQLQRKGNFTTTICSAVLKHDSEGRCYLPSVGDKYITKNISYVYHHSFIGSPALFEKETEVSLPLIMYENASKIDLLKVRRYDENVIMSKKCNLLMAMMLAKRGLKIYSCTVLVPSEHVIPKEIELDSEDLSDEKITDLKIDIMLTRLALRDFVESSYYLKTKGY